MKVKRNVVMPLDHPGQRQQAHAFLDRLPEDQLAAVCGLLEAMLSPLDRKLAVAPVDDEPATAGERAAVQAAIASLHEKGGIPIEVVLSDFGLTTDDFRKMAETPLPEDPTQ